MEKAWREVGEWVLRDVEKGVFRKSGASVLREVVRRVLHEIRRIV